ncbi:hypothetical protein CSC17_3366 [Klebsiella oxytoca]|nr:hypothetical protein CSC17_3366 [Klebsiella oxytoca]
MVIKNYYYFDACYKIEFAQYQQKLNLLFKKTIDRIICIDDKNYSHYHYLH